MIESEKLQKLYELWPAHANPCFYLAYSFVIYWIMEYYLKPSHLSTIVFQLLPQKNTSSTPCKTGDDINSKITDKCIIDQPSSLFMNRLLIAFIFSVFLFVATLHMQRIAEMHLFVILINYGKKALARDEYSDEMMLEAIYPMSSVCDIIPSVFIVGAKRTAFGTYGGSLKNFTAIDLAEFAGRAVLNETNTKPECIDHVIFGNVIQSSVDAIYLPRHVGLRLGVPENAPALGVNRICGSGFQVIVNAAEQILLGESKFVLAGGTENMSQTPFAARNIRFGTQLGVKYELEDTLWACLNDPHINTTMAMTAENLGAKYGVSRADADRFALRSQTLWKAVKQSMKFFERESVKGISDGASALLVAGEEAVSKYGLKPLARVVAWKAVGVDPNMMGIGPAPAIRSVLKKSGLTLQDIDLIEVNEAFAPQALAVQRELDLDEKKLNVSGGAISLGHPLAASGARISTHLIHEMKRRSVKYSIGSACIGGGQGIAILFENID
ncbi:unnamed protein product [Anisakis simplex]|uniref:3-ketoacyl-CoA thiolase, mitochondrial (inferred by orthology to a human protein) n=1 Tax=Anisakis simplex TaxID=6269 RepID=A0A0M3K0W1_ANISI|nr:unnamed protein product [Anisakis simplex]